ncbi:MAG: hypothetical protein ACRCZF_05845, partial [Gemmataceae bacterium]
KSFFAYDPNFRGGVLVDAGFFNGDDFADILTAPASGGSPHVRVFVGSNAAGAELGVGLNLAGINVDETPLVDGDRGNTGVSSIAYGASFDGTGKNRNILVTTARGTKTQIRTFPNIGNGKIAEGTALNAQTPPLDQNIDSLADGGTVGGFASES